MHRGYAAMPDAQLLVDDLHHWRLRVQGRRAVVTQLCGEHEGEGHSRRTETPTW